MNNANGSVFKYPDNVDTDVIIPARYLNTPNAKELAAHCMEDIDKDFVNKVHEGEGIAVGQEGGDLCAVQRVRVLPHGAGFCHGQPSHLRRAMQALCPPKPRLLLKA